jgi:predicted dehydrogenase/threonine dehydrogenase-like Zn-dependent dehydrogenase
MQQLTQQLKSGKMEILEVPFPALGKGQILVRNHYSVISAGTEGKTVTDARKGYIAKAKSRQKEVKQVIQMVKTNGLLPTYKLVMNKLEAPSALGYSTAGEVIAVHESVIKFKVGDYVACGGAGAYHADVVAVPVNLAVKLPADIDIKQAAFSTIASIAIQGIRQAALQMGENCVIIGMGLIGQITYKMLEASGINPIGVDISDAQVQQSVKAGISQVYNRNQDGLDQLINNLTAGLGVDSVIITAGTSSLDPVEFAGQICRRKGKVVIVGAVPTGFSRTNYYKKELDLRMSSSYGPGRYDSNYEEKGIDYPVAYVRWTENRNMQSFVEMLAKKRLDISPLITHTFDLENSAAAYDMILAREESFAGVLIKYDETGLPARKVQLKQEPFSASELNVGFIGAGSFAQNILLPRMKGLYNFKGISTARGNNARYVADKYGFEYCSDNADDIVKDEETNTIFITTRHNLHFEYVLKALNAGKHVFVEKPLVMTEAELAEVRIAYEQSDRRHLMVGFNRRFAQATQKLKKLFLEKQAKTINMRINAGFVPADHWVHDPTVGGGRIIGEACHFIDLAMYLAGAKITSVFANVLEEPNNLNDSVVINLRFANGSVASINYFSNGNKAVAKEFIEVFCGGTTVQIDDFRKVTIYGKSKKQVKYKTQDKGHSSEIEQFAESILNGKPCPISFEETYLSTLATFKVLESIRTRRAIELN